MRQKLSDPVGMRFFHILQSDLTESPRVDVRAPCRSRSPLTLLSARTSGVKPPYGAAHDSGEVVRSAAMESWALPSSQALARAAFAMLLCEEAPGFSAGWEKFE